MKLFLPSVCRFTAGTGLLFALFIQNVPAAEVHPPPPSITATNVSGGTRLSFPYPAAQKYTVLGTHDVAAPFTTNILASGRQVGPSFTFTNGAPVGAARVVVEPMDSRDLFIANVLKRLTYGPTPDELDYIRSIGPEQFITEQMASEQILDTIDVDPAITNTPPPPPPLPSPRWLYTNVTGTANGPNGTNGTNVWIYFNLPGSVYLDDLKLVMGNVAGNGPDLLNGNGDFESELSPLFRFGTTGDMNASRVVSGVSHSGTNSFLLVSSTGASGIESAITYPFATSISTTQRFTLSFWALATGTNSNARDTNMQLTVRLSGSLTVANVKVQLATSNAPPPPPAAPPAIAVTYARLTNATATLDDLRAWHVYRAVHSKRQLHEVLAQFFQNHFTTQYQKTKDYFDNGFNAGVFTNAALRRNIATDFHWRENMTFRELLLNPDCTFHDLLKASIESRAMIIYLDTILNSKGAPNQNYGRELLELHTMGADNGYIQQDIVELAKVWTGWRVTKKDASVADVPWSVPIPSTPSSNLVSFINAPGLWVLHYASNSHDLTTKRLFTNTLIDPRFGSFGGGQPYALILSNTAATSSNGFFEGYKVIDHLADLPYTMEFVSVKLCRTFVHDGFEFGIYDYRAASPSAEVQLIKNCMTAWSTPVNGRKGHLRSVLNAIFSSPLLRGHGASQQKIKTPLEFAVSAVRALRIVSTDGNGYVTSTADSDGYSLSGNASSSDGNRYPLGRMGGMGLFNKPEPDGWSESGNVWLSTANLCERMRFVQHLLMPGTSSLKGSDYQDATRSTSDPVKLLQSRRPGSATDAGAVVDYFLDLLYVGEGAGNLEWERQTAIDFLNSNDTGVPGSSPFASLSGTAYDGRVRGMVGLLMSLPRFQEQ